MSQYPPRGALFQNQNKQKETQPDYTGNLEIQTMLLRISLPKSMKE